VIPTQTLDGDDLSLAKKGNATGNRVGLRHVPPKGIQQGQLGATLRTGIGLGVEAS
jgi:hypothetical protein